MKIRQANKICDKSSWGGAAIYRPNVAASTPCFDAAESSPEALKKAVKEV